MKIILGITGGIAAYKACDVVSGLKAKGHDVCVIMTENATKFITPLTLATLSGHPVMSDMWAEISDSVEHIEVAKWCELFIVYPATCNIIAKFAHGIADDLLSTVFLALPKNVGRVIFPAANTNMIENPITRENIYALEQQNLNGYYTVVEDTIETRLACGDVGKGGVIKPREALDYIDLVIQKRSIK